MKRNWITKGAPIVALMFLVAFGMMSCSSDPMSSPDNGSESYITGPESEKQEVSFVDIEVTKKGNLREDESGECWYLDVNPEEIYELFLLNGVPTETEYMHAIVVGYIDDMQGICSNYSVLRVNHLTIY